MDTLQWGICLHAMELPGACTLDCCQHIIHLRVCVTPMQAQQCSAAPFLPSNQRGMQADRLWICIETERTRLQPTTCSRMRGKYTQRGLPQRLSSPPVLFPGLRASKKDQTPAASTCEHRPVTSACKQSTGFDLLNRGQLVIQQTACFYPAEVTAAAQMLH